MDSPTVNSVSETRLLAVMVGHCTIGVESQGRAGENVRGVLSGCSGESSGETRPKGLLVVVVVGFPCPARTRSLNGIGFACSQAPKSKDLTERSQGFGECNPCVIAGRQEGGKGR